MSKQLKLNEWNELFNLYESNNCKKTYEFNVQNTRHLPIQQNDDLNKNTKSFYTIINNLNSDLVF
ncbi:MAG: hypothetical protein IIT97_01135 [Mycoplasmataceae bacterium]|nr:hypothetical protein [Mycoplasmataceae bacterium]MBQ5543526.1 hypothetical protein [Mycoplasmataceae bacterium]